MDLRNSDPRLDSYWSKIVHTCRAFANLDGLVKTARLGLVAINALTRERFVNGVHTCNLNLVIVRTIDMQLAAMVMESVFLELATVIQLGLVFPVKSQPVPTTVESMVNALLSLQVPTFPLGTQSVLALRVGMELLVMSQSASYLARAMVSA